MAPTYKIAGSVLIVQDESTRTRHRCASPEAALELAAKLEAEAIATEEARAAEGRLLLSMGVDVVLPHPADLGLDLPVDANGRLAPEDAATLRAAVLAQVPGSDPPTAPPTAEEATQTPDTAGTGEQPVEGTGGPVVAVETEWRDSTGQMVMAISTEALAPVTLWRSIGGRTAEFVVEPGKPTNRWAKGNPGETFELRVGGPDGDLLATATVPGEPNPDAPPPADS